MPPERSCTVEKTWIGRLPKGCDLLEALTGLCRDRSVRLGRVEAFGAVTKARLGFFDQATREYRFTSFDEPREIAHLIGNVSLKEGEAMVHAHVTLAAEDGSAIGGHLAPGTEVFACEYVLQSLAGEALVRGFDDETGLPLWMA